LCTSFLTYDCKIAPELKQLLQQGRHEIPAELEDNTKLFGTGDIIQTEFGDLPKAVKTKM
jgi:hypothetical protein